MNERQITGRKSKDVPALVVDHVSESRRVDDVQAQLDVVLDQH